MSETTERHEPDAHEEALRVVARLARPTHDDDHIERMVEAMRTNYTGREEQVETVAAALAAAERRGRRAGLEEAAQVAERLSDEWEAKANADNSPHYDDRWGQAVGAEAIAAAIRDLAGEETEK